MRPFPQYIEDKKIRDNTWEKYRYEVIGNAGIAIFFMGNKIVDGSTVLADGVRKEFEIAHELGLALIPVGCSGSMAKELWQEVMSNVANFYNESNKELIQSINELGEEVEKPEQLISKIIKIIDLMSKE